MLTQLTTLKTRLAIPDTDVQYDSILTAAIKAISARFDLETGRTLARTENATFEFRADETQIAVPCYPIESVTNFELKYTESEDWVEQTGIEYLVRASCVVALRYPLSAFHYPLPLARVTYTGGYVLPGTVPGAGQTALPQDLEQAAVEQAVFWFQNREAVGLIRDWPSGGNYIQLADTDLLPAVRAVVGRYGRIVL